MSTTGIGPLPKEVRDLDDWVELSHARRLTDGLPVPGPALRPLRL